ncbi:LacI family DNA-binding transcriptional regulator [Arachidicoccus terrestris]|uniref:LacI family DNA-binding transcriptional regulator n=1 Tax=Arachidicoccus terrestris TaxID=2875539 RepID=UPI001CC7E03D|nr:LacI family DNA-binding transcriptional regulator [Arachidicoccus terrestris]UAY56029.1 LacI family transcriptional regulator [Arachidicoccus terrestris]
MTKGKRISIVDIARELGVAKSTVSSVLNGKTGERRISEETRKAILEYIEKSGFRPNAVARSLRTGRSRIIGMLVEDISNPFFASIAHLVEQKVARLGYRILLSSTENDNRNAADALTTFWEQQVDGYIIVPPAELPEEIMQKIFGHSPLVFFDRSVTSMGASSVMIENYSSMILATRHLIEKGFKHIALITIESAQFQMIDRRRGYEDALYHRQLESYICEVDHQLSNDLIKDQIKLFLQTNPEIDSIVFSTNYIALLGLQVIKALDLKIPEDIGVIGFDESPYYELMNPAITSIVQPLTEMADCIVESLMEQIESDVNGLVKTKSIRLTATLVERASTAPIV